MNQQANTETGGALGAIREILGRIRHRCDIQVNPRDTIAHKLLQEHTAQDRMTFATAGVLDICIIALDGF